MGKYTSDDIKRLADFVRASRDRRPFALLTGAGCSLAAGIPLASALVKEILDDERFQPHLHGLTDSEKADYGKLMSRLGRNERKDLLDKHLSTAKINWAHIAIAALMCDGYIGRVLTFNFDNVLARACGVCGLYPATYDFVTGASQSTDHIVSTAIIHLHGQGYGLSMLNSEEETKAHAEKLRGLIRDTLGNAPLLVIGYSGQSDRVFPIFIEEYKADERLFWCSHDDDPSADVSKLLKQSLHLTGHLGGVDADRFLVELAQELGCFPPKVFRDPIDHIRDEVGSVVEFPSADAKKTKPDDVLSELHKLLNSYESDPTAGNPGLRAMVLIMKGEYDAVVDARAEGTDVPDDLYIIALMSSGIALAGKARTTNDPALFDAAIEKYEAALAIKPDEHEALFNWGAALGEKAGATDDPALFDAAIEKYEAALAIKPNDHETLSNWGAALGEKAGATNDPALFDAAGEKYEAALAIKPESHEALFNWGAALADKAEATDDPALFDAAGEKYEAALAIKPDSHEALNNWGAALAGKARSTDDPALFDAAGEKYEAALAIKPDSHEALNNWGAALGEKAGATDDPALFDAAGEKYEAALAIKPESHEALFNWGAALAGKARATNDPALFDAAGEKYEAALAIKPESHETLFNWGAALADKAGATDDPALFDAAGEKYEAALAIKPDSHEALFNWGAALADKAEATDDPALFDAAGEKYEAALAIKPDSHEALNNWGSMFLRKMAMIGDKEILEEAKPILDRALALAPEQAYNSACLAALTGRKADARRHLETCLNHGTLPSKAHLEADDDLDSLRDETWFAELLGKFDG